MGILFFFPTGILRLAVLFKVVTLCALESLVHPSFHSITLGSGLRGLPEFQPSCPHPRKMKGEREKGQKRHTPF